MSSTSQTLSRPVSFDPAAATGRRVVPLRIGFSWSFVGWVGYAACQWLMLSVMANLQRRGVQSTDARNEYSFPDYVTLRMMGSGLAVGFILIAGAFLKLSWT